MTISSHVPESIQYPYYLEGSPTPSHPSRNVDGGVVARDGSGIMDEQKIRRLIKIGRFEADLQIEAGEKRHAWLDQLEALLEPLPPQTDDDQDVLAKVGVDLRIAE